MDTKKNNNKMKILKIKQITKATIIPLFFSFLSVLGHCVIGICLMEQEDNRSIGDISFWNFFLLLLVVHKYEQYI